MKKYIGAVVLILVAATAVGVSIARKNETKENPLPKVTIGMVTFPGYAPLYLAEEKRFFEGVDVQLRRIESMSDTRAAMRSGGITMYTATYDIYQSTKEVEPIGVGFLAVDESHGGDGIAVASGINSISDLRGKKVGAEAGFPPYFILQYLLDEAGMTLKDVDFQDLPTTDAGNAFAAGQLDAAGIYEPSLSASVGARAGAKVFASSADTPGLIQDLLFADETFAAKNPDALAALAAGWFKALDYIETNPDESYEIMGRAFNVTAQEMKDFKTGISWIGKAENIRMFDAASESNVYRTYTRVCDILQKNGNTNQCLKAEDQLTSVIVNRFK